MQHWGLEVSEKMTSLHLSLFLIILVCFFFFSTCGSKDYSTPRFSLWANSSHVWPLTLKPLRFTHSLKFILNLSSCSACCVHTVVELRLLKCGKLNWSPATGFGGCVNIHSLTLQQRTYNVLTREQGLTCCYCHKLRRLPITVHMDAMSSVYQTAATYSDSQYAADFQ